jgi:hypothetical protein
VVVDGLIVASLFAPIVRALRLMALFSRNIESKKRSEIKQPILRSDQGCSGSGIFARERNANKMRTAPKYARNT